VGPELKVPGPGEIRSPRSWRKSGAHGYPTNLVFQSEVSAELPICSRLEDFPNEFSGSLPRLNVLKAFLWRSKSYRNENFVLVLRTD